jgi:hypothetical protein
LESEILMADDSFDAPADSTLAGKSELGRAGDSRANQVHQDVHSFTGWAKTTQRRELGHGADDLRFVVGVFVISQRGIERYTRRVFTIETSECGFTTGMNLNRQRCSDGKNFEEKGERLPRRILRFPFDERAPVNEAPCRVCGVVTKPHLGFGKTGRFNASKLCESKGRAPSVGPRSIGYLEHAYSSKSPLG